MDPSLNGPSLINLVGAIHALVMAVAIARLTRNAPAAKWLALLLTVFSILMLNAVLLHTGYILVVPHVAQLHAPLQFLVGPFLLFYVQALLTGREHMSSRSWFHGLPCVAVAIWLVPFYVQDAEAKRQFLAAALREYPLEWRIRQVLLITQLLMYLAAMIMVLVRTFRGNQAIPGRWICARNTVLLFTVVWVLITVRFWVAYTVNSVFVVPLVLAGFVYATGYAAVKESKVFAAPLEPEVTATPRAKYQWSSLETRRADECAAALQKLMEDDKLYTDAALSLHRLAKRLSMSPHHVSQVLNDRLGTSFAEFVNSYRVNMVKEALLDPSRRHLTVIAIAEEAGFSSKSAFNATFKKHVGMGPIAFRRLRTRT
jgi:AraC-like DNA-binding protein